jgi:hypothetical protein
MGYGLKMSKDGGPCPPYLIKVTLQGWIIGAQAELGPEDAVPKPELGNEF